MVHQWLTKTCRMAHVCMCFALPSVSACRCDAGPTRPEPIEQAAPEPARDSDSRSVPGVLTPVLWPGDPGPVDVTFSISQDQANHPISPLIYGTNFNGSDDAVQRWGLIRHGGNRMTAFNWENNASNAGSDWKFFNSGSPDDDDKPADCYMHLIDAALPLSAAAIVTVSNSDYVSGDERQDDVRKSGPDYLSKRFKRNYPKKPTPFTAMPDLGDNAVYQDEMLAYLKAQRPNADIIVSMDNEPDLWSHTHAEVFLNKLTYADLWRRNHDFAKAAKAVLPDAKVLGFVSYGYAGFTNLQDAPDAHGRRFLDWYLEQARDAEKAEGKRLIDYLDVHWYPEVQAGDQRIVSDQVTPDVVAARVQAPRSLWDPKYEERSWIRDKIQGPIKLVPWLKARIRAHYPGTKLAITEWNYGGGNHISGAIAVADVLGIFGRQGVDLAAYWWMHGNEPFARAAFRIYRNYDGRGGSFGDVSIDAASSDTATATVYASVESVNQARIVIVVINKTEQPKRAGIKLAHRVVYGKAQVFVLARDEAVVKPSSTLTPVATNAFAYDMPPHSISVVIPET